MNKITGGYGWNKKSATKWRSPGRRRTISALRKRRRGGGGTKKRRKH